MCNIEARHCEQCGETSPEYVSNTHYSGCCNELIIFEGEQNTCRDHHRDATYVADVLAADRIDRAASAEAARWGVPRLDAATVAEYTARADSPMEAGEMVEELAKLAAEDDRARAGRVEATARPAVRKSGQTSRELTAERLADSGNEDMRIISHFYGPWWRVEGANGEFLFDREQINLVADSLAARHMVRSTEGKES